MRILALALTCALTLSLAPLSTGCGAAGPAIATGISALIDVFDWLAPKVDAVSSVVTAAEAGGLLPGPEAAKALKIAAELQTLISESKDAAQQGKRAAPEVIARIEQLWAQLIAVGQPLGVQTGDAAMRLGAPPGTIVVPTASEVHKRLMATGK